MPGEQEKENEHRSNRVKNWEGHRIVPKGANLVLQITESKNHDKFKLAISDGNLVKKDLAAWASGRWQYHVSSRFYLHWTRVGNQVERQSPAPPGKGLTKPRLEVRAPAQQDKCSVGSWNTSQHHPHHNVTRKAGDE